EMFGVPVQWQATRDELLMAVPGLALRAVAFKVIDVYPYGQACLAAVAVGAIGEQAAAPKALLDQLGIGFSIDKVRRRCYLRACIQTSQIAAWIDGSGIKLQSFKARLGWVTHDGSR